MRIGITGAGHIGGTLAKRFVDAGHEVAVSNSRPRRRSRVSSRSSATGCRQRRSRTPRASAKQSASLPSDVVTGKVLGHLRSPPELDLAHRLLIAELEP
jgi:predicted dinucleotide-binding enzyme